MIYDITNTDKNINRTAPKMPHSIITFKGIFVKKI